MDNYVLEREKYFLNIPYSIFEDKNYCNDGVKNSERNFSPAARKYREERTFPQ